MQEAHLLELDLHHGGDGLRVELGRTRRGDGIEQPHRVGSEPAQKLAWPGGARAHQIRALARIPRQVVGPDHAAPAQCVLRRDDLVVALEQRDAMLVPEYEVEEAVEDGVKLLNGWSVKNFVVEDGELQRLILQRCLRVFDDDFRFAPEFDSNDLQEIEAGLVIMAVGQDTDLSYLDGDIDLNERRNVILDAAFQTSAEGVFAAGDIKSPGLVISAVAEGKRASMSIDNYLGGNGIYFGRSIEIPDTRLDPRIWDIPREKPATLAVEDRNSSFAEVESALTRDQALCEADRCMRCDRNSVQELFLRSTVETYEITR